MTTQPTRANGGKGLVVLGAELGPGRLGAVRCRDGRVVAIGEVTPQPDDTVVDARGGAVLTGLHDHHLHLLAEAARRESVDVSHGRLAEAVTRARRARPEGWLRLTGWRSASHGELDRHELDRIDPRPMRVQDATGSVWYLNSAALDAVLAGRVAPPGMSVGDDGAPDGRLLRLDDWLRERLGPAAPPDVLSVGDELLARGVTALTDATATNGPDELAILAAAGVGQRLTAMTAHPDVDPPSGVTLGPVKVLLDDDALPPIDDLAARIVRARTAGRSVAVHCVTRLQLVVTLAAFDSAGPPRAGDRIEHGAVVPPDLVPVLRKHRLTVVTQPGFVADRGDRYLDEVPHEDRAWLYPVSSLLAAGVPVLAGSDAPYGPIDPWVGVVAAQSRRAPDGRAVGIDEAVDANRALALYGSRRVTVGDPADLCVLAARPWSSLVTAKPADIEVAATVVAGHLAYGSPA